MGSALEVADVFRRHGEAFRRDRAVHLGRVERRVMAAIEACRTAALGGQVEQCGECGLSRPAYNSCRNRHCPKCQGLARAEWLEARPAELLPMPYFHVVFTLPAPAAAIAFHNKRVVYAVLFRAAADALRDIAADPRHLDAEIGAVARRERPSLCPSPDARKRARLQRRQALYRGNATVCRTRRRQGGYDSHALREWLVERGTAPVIPPRKNRKVQYDYDRAIYKQCNVIERMFCRFKDRRRIATRFDRNINNFMGAISLAAAVMWWL